MNEVTAELDGIVDAAVDEELDRYAEDYVVAEHKGDADEEGPPFDVRVPRPQLIGLAKLYALAKTAPPSGEGLATHLVVHGVTPFHNPGRRPGGVWGLGYEAEFVEPGKVDTIAYEPGTTYLTVGSVGQRVNIGLQASGQFVHGGPIGSTALDAGVPHSSFRASTKQDLALTIELALRLLKIQGGPFGNGGVKWNMYRQDDALDAHQVLLQTIRVPSGAAASKIRVTTWATRSGAFGWRRRTWRYKPIDFDVDVIS